MHTYEELLAKIERIEQGRIAPRDDFYLKERAQRMKRQKTLARHIERARDNGVLTPEELRENAQKGWLLSWESENSSKNN